MPVHQWYGNLSRREAIRITVAAGLGVSFTARRTAAMQDMRTNPIPSTGERLPVVGLGTNRFGGQAPDPDSPLCDVIGALAEHGGRLIDTARGYGAAEEVIGACMQNRDRYFIATKLGLRGDAVAGMSAADVQAELEQAFTRLRTDVIDLMMVHDFGAPERLLPVMRELKQAGRFRYIGMSTSSDSQYDALIAAIASERLDFIEVDYALGNRNAAERVLPAAADAGAAVIINVPLGGRSQLLQHLSGRPLPDWAADIDVTSWAQVLLKYVLSHPAVTCVIPGTTRVEHVIDNCAAGRGRLPDAALRRRLEAFADAL